MEILASKQVDIYISIATSLLGAVFGIILERVVKGSGETMPVAGGISSVSVSMQQVVKVSVGSKNRTNDQLVFFLASLFLLSAGVAYLFFREEVLAAALLLVLFVFGAWAGLVVHSLYRGTFQGWRWCVYLLVMFLFALAAVRVVGLAKVPMYAPRDFKYIQDIVNYSGILSLKKTDIDFMWFGFHLLGVIVGSRVIDYPFVK
ncbi:hypothetical protein [Litchfieldella anticariensis]|uniref:hypothetical protein n=1 Tax=Litchfieldella anticariensis TaxID=258591 RepID=UPI000482A34F|nr:hypothetical protein [Halomonas anticariensis]